MPPIEMPPTRGSDAEGIEDGERVGGELLEVTGPARRR